jgi:hypothetical protein
MPIIVAGSVIIPTGQQTLAVTLPSLPTGLLLAYFAVMSGSSGWEAGATFTTSSPTITGFTINSSAASTGAACYVNYLAFGVPVNA